MAETVLSMGDIGLGDSAIPAQLESRLDNNPDDAETYLRQCRARASKYDAASGRF